MHRMSTEWQIAPGSVAKGEMLFVVGDVHGYVDHLRALRHLIQDQIDSRPDLACKIIYVGDYIDRGPHSKDVLEFLAEDWQFGGVDSIYLYGNHEYFLKSLLRMEDGDDQLELAETVLMWLQNGGYAALRSFGVKFEVSNFGDLRVLRDAIRANLSPVVMEFLGQLRLWYRQDDYVFVHAGVNPLAPFNELHPSDLLWMRQPFLNAGAEWQHRFSVVHGHTPSCPEVLPHRIGVDTGVFLTEALTAAQLYDCKVRFLTVASDDSGVWQEELSKGVPQPYQLLDAESWSPV